MKNIDPELLQGALNDHEAELILLRNLVCALTDMHPNRERVITSFRRETEGYCKSAPTGTDPELLVEVMARLQMYLLLLAP